LNNLEAFRWFRKAADMDNATAMFNLGELFGKGQGGPKDEAESLSWYRKAAAGGHQGAKEILQKKGLSLAK
jgi:hypothetical protein